MTVIHDANPLKVSLCINDTTSHVIVHKDPGREERTKKYDISSTRPQALSSCLKI
jgi:hypothetical protein